jgi:hypothetical protein
MLKTSNMVCQCRQVEVARRLVFGAMLFIEKKKMFQN